MDKKYNPLMIFFFVLLFYLIYIVIKPVVSAIFGSFLLAFSFYKVNKFIEKRVVKKGIASFLTILIILIIIIIPSFILINSIAQESVSAYHKIRLTDLPNKVAHYSETQLGEYVGVIVNNAIYLIVNSTSSFILSIPQFALTILITIFLSYYLLKESDVLLDFIKRHLPFKDNGKEMILQKLKVTINALIFGTILTALIQGALGAIGFYIFGVSSPILWGFVMAIFSIIPLFGTGIVWAPAGVIKLIQGDLFSGIGVLLFGALIVSTIDNFLRPKLISKKADINPGVVLVGVIGGIASMGFIGLFAGPLILVISLEIFKLRKELI